MIDWFSTKPTQVSSEMLTQVYRDRPALGLCHIPSRVQFRLQNESPSHPRNQTSQQETSFLNGIFPRGLAVRQFKLTSLNHYTMQPSLLGFFLSLGDMILTSRATPLAQVGPPSKCFLDPTYTVTSQKGVEGAGATGSKACDGTGGKAYPLIPLTIKSHTLKPSTRLQPRTAGLLQHRRDHRSRRTAGSRSRCNRQPRRLRQRVLQHRDARSLGRREKVSRWRVAMLSYSVPKHAGGQRGADEA